MLHYCRTVNQGWYSYYSCTSGFFLPNAPPIRNKVVLKVWPPVCPYLANVVWSRHALAIPRWLKALFPLDQSMQLLAQKTIDLITN